ncbi:MAG: peroxide stress protein YaaA [Oscillospiraceae bacterium]|nr:peroxide stress protein YaaA [Oscillospiraceae bacterium]
MRIIISPAKKMRTDTDSLPWRDLPVLLPRTQQLLDRLRGMTYAQLKALWNCNDKIAAQNVERLTHMDLRENLTPALLAYDGIQYQYMAPGVFSDGEYDYVQEHLRILSGFYGILRPFDGVTPYRLEMQAKLQMGESGNLYAFWGDTIARELTESTEYVVNLASKEYSQAVTPYLPDGVRLINCVFGEEKGGKVIEKGTQCKMARGEMVRWMAENRITNPEDLKGFDRLQYQYAPENSAYNVLVFLKKEETGTGL